MQISKRIFTLLLAIGCSTALWAQDNMGIKPPTELKVERSAGSFKAAADRMEAKEAKGARKGYTDANVRKYAATITPEDLEAHLSFLASDACQGRETARPGQKIAAQYLASQFMKIGLKPGNNGSWFQEFELVEVDIRNVDLSFDGKTMYKTGTDFAYFNKAALAESFNAPLIFGGFGINDAKYNNLEGLNVDGKAVLVLNGEPEVDGKFLLSGDTEGSKWADTRAKAKALQAKGAKAAIFVLSDADYKRIAGNPWLRHMMTGSSLKLKYEADADGGSMAVLMIPERIANPLIKKSKMDCGELREALNKSPKVQAIDFKKYKLEVISDATKEVVTGENVLGFMEGTDKKDEVVVLTAHYDHLGIKDGEVYNGADDDGSGTSTILELAEAFAQAKKDGFGPRRSILFMPVSGEEKGLLGSQYYTDHPIYPLEKTVCDLNIDMIGRIDKEHEGNENYVYIIGSDKLSTELHRANEAANKKVTNLELDYTYNSPDDPNRFYYRSDHYNFAKNNIPVIFYFTGIHEDYHKATDTIDKILFPKMAKIARLVFATAWEVANRDTKLKVDVKNDFPASR